MNKLFFFCVNVVSCQAGCEDGPNPGPNGYNYVGSQFEYVSEVVEQKLSLDGTFDEYRFVVKFQSLTKASEYALTINPEYEPSSGVKDIVLLELTMNNDKQAWHVDNGLIKNVETGYVLGHLENGNLGGFKASNPHRELLWNFDGYCIRSLDNGKIIGFSADISHQLGKTVKLIEAQTAVINSTIDRINIPPAQPKAEKKSYIQHVSLEYQIATLNKQYSPILSDNLIYNYKEEQFSKWDENYCITGQILDCDVLFGLEQLKIGSSVSPYPLPPKHYFRYGREYNTSYERTEPFDEFETCYFDQYNDIEENHFQKLVPNEHGWLTPSGGVFVERSPTRQYKDQFGRTVVEESFEYFIDYGE